MSGQGKKKGAKGQPGDDPRPDAVPAAPAEPGPAAFEPEAGVSAWSVAWRQLKRDKVAMFAGASLLLLGVVSVLSPLLANNKPLVARYQGHLVFPAFKDYLDENIPIPFGIPDALRGWGSFFSPSYRVLERPRGQALPDWRKIRNEIDALETGGPTGRAQAGDWYLAAPVPYYYKETSSAIKQLPFADVAELELLEGRAQGERIELVPTIPWKDTWTRFRGRDRQLDLEGVAVIHTALPGAGAAGWAVHLVDGVAPSDDATLDGLELGADPRPLARGQTLTVKGRRMRFGKPPAHPFGTDDVGRDVLSRLIHGTVIAGSVGIVSVGIYVLIGIILGGLAGYFRGWVDMAISRLIEIVICFPTFFLIITIVAVFEKPSIYNIMITLGLVSWTGVARLVRGEFLKAMSEDYVQAARALGLGHARIIFRHILPNSIAPVFVSASFGVAGAILAESGLSFLGFGVAPPTASWGEVLQQGRRYINEGLYHLVWFPGLCIFYTVTMFNLLGEGLRDALDPKLRQ